MARIRSIKPEFPQSESMGRVSRDARLLFIELWTLADDEGRLRGNSRMLASLLFPYDNDAPELIDDWLAELQEEACITCYAIGKDHYLQICNWLNHQKIDKPSKSKIPPIDESSRILANVRECSSEDQGSRIKDQGEDQDQNTSAEPLRDSTPVVLEPAVITITRNDNTQHPITQSQIDRWQSLYPVVDVMQELRNMAGWSDANRPKRKTKSGMEKFINAWLSRQQNRGIPNAQHQRNPGITASNLDDTSWIDGLSESL